MNKQYLNKCSNCQSLTQQAVALDCAHSLCIYCLQLLLQFEEKKQQLADQMEIECPSCSYQTLLSIVLAYKMVRPIRELYKPQLNKNTKNLVCMECLDELFSIQEYLGGNHQSHQILPIEKASFLVKDMLFFQGKELQQTKGKLYLQTQKIMHCKSKLNALFNRNIKMIKMQFEYLKEQIERKQLQMLQLYQFKIQNAFGEIDQTIALNRKCIEMCQSHLHWIEQNIKQSNDAYQVVDYFITNRNKIKDLTNPSDYYKSLQYAHQLRQDRQILDSEEFKNLTLDISPQLTESSTTCSLKSTYFESKRKQVKGIAQHQILHQEAHGKNSGLKKVASLKCRLLKF